MQKSKSGKILVIGATGKTGMHLVKILAAKGENVLSATRKPETMQEQFPATVEGLKFDFDFPETFAPALEGVAKVFLMVRPGDPRPHDTAIPFIDVMKKSGVKLIVTLTAMGVELVDDFPLRMIEKYIENSGIAWTHLRPNWFFQNFNSGPMLADIKNTGALHLPTGDAKISFIDTQDIAAVAAVVITEPGHANKSYTLTGWEALDHYQVMDALSSAAGKKMDYVPISDDESRRALAAIGLTEVDIERKIFMFDRVKKGFCSIISQDVEMILKRNPITVEQYAKSNASVWK